MQTVADDCSGDCQVSGAGTAANDFADLVYYICDLSNDRNAFTGFLSVTCWKSV